MLCETGMRKRPAGLGGFDGEPLLATAICRSVMTMMSREKIELNNVHTGSHSMQVTMLAVWAADMDRDERCVGC